MAQTITDQCCIAGGGPAGMMLGYLLGRAGVSCVVLEKHADFLRDFRGDTVHPSTLKIMHELDLLQEFLQLPHSEIDAPSVDILSLIHISEPTRQAEISYAVFCLKKKK